MSVSVRDAVSVLERVRVEQINPITSFLELLGDKTAWITIGRSAGAVTRP
jgi:hypothetical protein